MIISAIGDSLTEGDYGVKGKTGIANVHKENYPFFLSQISGCEVRNFGKCGFRASHYLKYYKDGNVDIKNSDIVIIMLGTNGGFDPDTDTPDNRDFRELITLIKRDAENAEIVLCTPPHVTENPQFSNCGYIQNVVKGQNYIKKYAAENHLKLIDIGGCGLFTAENEEIYQANDGLHFVEKGYKLLARYISDNLF